MKLFHWFVGDMWENGFWKLWRFSAQTVWQIRPWEIESLLSKMLCCGKSGLKIERHFVYLCCCPPADESIHQSVICLDKDLSENFIAWHQTAAILSRRAVVKLLLERLIAQVLIGRVAHVTYTRESASHHRPAVNDHLLINHIHRLSPTDLYPVKCFGCQT